VGRRVAQQREHVFLRFGLMHGIPLRAMRRIYRGCAPIRVRTKWLRSHLFINMGDYFDSTIA
jgi:hypothetical protein